MCPTLTGQQSPQKNQRIFYRDHILSPSIFCVWSGVNSQMDRSWTTLWGLVQDRLITTSMSELHTCLFLWLPASSFVHEFPLAGQSQFVKTPDKETSHWHFWGRRDLNIFWTRSRTFFILWDLYSSATYSPVDLFKDRSKDQLSFFPCPPTWVKLTSSNVFTISRLELKNEALGWHHLTKLTLSTSEHSQHWRLNLKPVGMNL